MSDVMYMFPPVTLEDEATEVNHDTNRPAEVIDLAGMSAVYLAVTGTAGTMKIDAQVSMDGTNWLIVGAIQLADGVNKTSNTGIIATGAYKIPVAGFTKFRAFMSSVSGTEITIKATVFPR